MPGRRDDLVARRQAQGYSQEALAERLGVDRCTVARWEQGATTPQPWHRPRIARALSLSLEEFDGVLTSESPGSATSSSFGDQPGQEDALAAERRPSDECICCRDLDSILEAPWSPAGTAQVLYELAGGAMDRRNFLFASGGALTGLATQWADGLDKAAVATALTDQPKRITLSVIDRLDSRLADLRRLDDAIGGKRLRRLAVAEFRMLTQLAADASESTYRRLFATIAEAARISGWLHFDTGRQAQAQSYYIAALRASATAADPLAGANILACMSWQATVIGHNHEGVSLIGSARGRLDRKTCPRLDALLASRQARAHAAAGDAAACGRSLNEAEARLEAASSSEGDPDWIYFFDDAELAAQAGSCWIELDRPDRARPLIDTALRTIDADYVRDRAIYHARSAMIYVRQRELELACDELETAIELAGRTGSEHCISTVRHARSQLSRYEREPRVTELDDSLSVLIA